MSRPCSRRTWLSPKRYKRQQSSFHTFSSKMQARIDPDDIGFAICTQHEAPFFTATRWQRSKERERKGKEVRIRFPLFKYMRRVAPEQKKAKCMCFCRRRDEVLRQHARYKPLDPSVNLFLLIICHNYKDDFHCQLPLLCYNFSPRNSPSSATSRAPKHKRKRFVFLSSEWRRRGKAVSSRPDRMAMWRIKGRELGHILLAGSTLHRHGVEARSTDWRDESEWL